jgi:hypothetical protein
MRVGWFRTLLVLFSIYFLLFLLGNLQFWHPLVGVAITSPFVFYQYGTFVACAFIVIHSFGYGIILLYQSIAVLHPFMRIAKNTTTAFYMILVKIVTITQRIAPPLV